MNGWLSRFAWLTATAAFVLIIAGALVTSHRAGLAVPDWPTTFHYSMFRYPVAQWVGNIRYEHVHRLIASGVGLLTVILAVWIGLVEPRRGPRWLGAGAVGLVIVQGILGGVTVLERLPPWVSIAHAALAQTFFGVLIALALVSTRQWNDPPTELAGARGFQWLALVTTAVVFLQLLLGAMIRHAERALVPHLAVALTLVGLVALVADVFQQHVKRRDLSRPALALAGLVVAQWFVGVAALIVHAPKQNGVTVSLAQAILPSIHVALGALILATSLALSLRSLHCLRPKYPLVPTPAGGAALLRPQRNA